MTLSLAQIEAQVVTEVPFEFEPFLADGSPSGITLMVLSDQSPTVRDGLTAIANRQRRRDEINAAKQRSSRPGEVFTPIETDVQDALDMTALRIAGWRGMEDEFSRENAIRLLRLMPGFISQVTTKAAEVAGFTKTSPEI